MRYMIFALTFVCLFAGSISVAQGAEIDLGSRRELFVDHFLIESMDGVRLELQHPQPANVALRFDRPWEGTYSQYVTILQDGPKYLMYYRGLPSLADEGTDRECTCLAESDDGIQWTRPNLGIYTVRGTRENNVVLSGHTPASHNFTPFIDTRPGIPAAERFKGVGGLGGKNHGGLFGFVSEDGRRWSKTQEEPLVTEGAFDSQNLVFWSETEQRYVCYFRTFTKGGTQSVRTISRATSADFLHWDPPSEMHFDGQGEEHLYTNATHPYFRAPQIYIALPMRFFSHSGMSDAAFATIAPNVDPAYSRQVRGECTDGVFMTSRGGDRYDRLFREAFFRPGLDPGNWASRTVMAACGIVPTSPNEMSLYYGQHDGQTTAHLLRCTLRTDGFVSVSAPFAGGTLLTKPLQFTGKELEINYSTSAAGHVAVEIQDAAGNPLPGLALADCDIIIGDEIERVVNWRGEGDLGGLSGQPVRLKFDMKDADLYSLRFR